MSDRENVLPDVGPGAPPRQNGELIFAAPWESRIFGLTMALFESGRFEWTEFQSRLIAAIAEHEAQLEGGVEYDYYGCWLEAFRSLATDKGWLDPASLRDLEDTLRARPAGHDH